jgi:hypothetical protein
MAQTNETLRALDALIAKVEARLALTPDYIELTALRKARAEINAVSHRRGEVAIDDVTGEKFLTVPTGEFAVRSSKPSQLEAALAALSHVGHPLTTPEMVRRVRALGATVGGNNPNTNLGSTLSRAEQVVSVRWMGDAAWWFSGRPVPQEPSLLKEAAE